MTKLKFIIVVAILLTPQFSWAGGLLTNTNQSVTFLRNPARDAAIAIDGVYFNPAGVVFLKDGIYQSIYRMHIKLVVSIRPLVLLLSEHRMRAKPIRPSKELPMRPSFLLYKQPTTKASGVSNSILPLPAEEVKQSLPKA